MYGLCSRTSAVFFSRESASKLHCFIVLIEWLNGINELAVLLYLPYYCNTIGMATSRFIFNYLLRYLLLQKTLWFRQGTVTYLREENNLVIEGLWSLIITVCCIVSFNIRLQRKIELTNCWVVKSFHFHDDIPLHFVSLCFASNTSTETFCISSSKTSKTKHNLSHFIIQKFIFPKGKLHSLVTMLQQLNSFL